MRPQQNRRIRGRNNHNNNNNNNNNRGNSNILARNYESNGPDVKVRGNARHIADKYATLARDAQASGNRVMAENYLQHAEHYTRIILSVQAQMPQAAPPAFEPEEEHDESIIASKPIHASPDLNSETLREEFSTEIPELKETFSGEKVAAPSAPVRTKRLNRAPHKVDPIKIPLFDMPEPGETISPNAAISSSSEGSQSEDYSISASPEIAETEIKKKIRRPRQAIRSQKSHQITEK